MWYKRLVFWVVLILTILNVNPLARVPPPEATAVMTSSSRSNKFKNSDSEPVWSQRFSNGTHSRTHTRTHTHAHTHTTRTYITGVVWLNVVVLQDKHDKTIFRLLATDEDGVQVTGRQYGVVMQLKADRGGGGTLDIPRFYVAVGRRRQGCAHTQHTHSTQVHTHAQQVRLTVDNGDASAGVQTQRTTGAPAPLCCAGSQAHDIPAAR